MDRSKTGTLVEMLVLIAAGLFLLLHPAATLIIAARILGIGLVVFGIVLAVSGYMRRDVDNGMPKLAGGIIVAIVGIVVLAAPRFVISIFPFLAGVIIIICGAGELISALDKRKSGDSSSWPVMAVLSLLVIILGIVILINPFSTMARLVRAIGIVLIIGGVVGIAGSLTR